MTSLDDLLALQRKLRQGHILRLARTGLPTSQIARQLGMSRSWVGRILADLIAAGAITEGELQAARARHAWSTQGAA